MGLNYNEIKFLLWAKQEGLDFAKVMMIGRQRLYLNVGTMQAVLTLFGKSEPKAKLEAMFSEQAGYAEPFFKYLGAREINSIDASSYENASHVLDMNQPISEDLKHRFSLVYDGGSLEHVFNFPGAIKNCMEMIALNGHFIGVTPCNNYMGHGFYQFSPELFFRIFTPANGFKLERMIVYEVSSMARWYEVRDPEELGKRVETLTRRNTLLVVQARRVAITPLFATTPQQSDYSALWHEGQNAKQAKTLPLSVRIKMNLPPGLKKVFWRLKEWKQPRMKADAFKEIHVPKSK